MKTVNLEKYLNNGIKSLVKNALKNTIKNPKETSFFLRYSMNVKKAESKRRKAVKNGEHIPPFLIASITSSCNLNCSGCYNRAREDASSISELSREEWKSIFIEAAELGISVIILAGGEPLMRRDVLEEAALYPSLLFPIFTNGTMLDDKFLGVFKKHRNLVPIISIEGGEEFTDNRRGQGVYASAALVMEKLKEHGLLFGASITVTNKNLYSVVHEETILNLKNKGCKAAVFVEYVPVTDQNSVLDDNQRDFLMKRITELKNKKDMIIISFPGDEKISGGCLAAGRGFFHVSANGKAEPCPFSPYSDTNVKNTSLIKALQSPLFLQLRNDNTLLADHNGGCVLFDKAEHVKSIANDP